MGIFSHTSKNYNTNRQAQAGHDNNQRLTTGEGPPTRCGRINARGTPSTAQPRYRPKRHLWGRIATLLFYLLLLAVLYDGWRNRGDNYLTAESGLGYALGIVGGSMMFTMLLYTARKKIRFMRRLGALKHWFRAHMVFGVLPPHPAALSR